ncbi:hypothetical protein D0864_08733 [Hortaea werneckii]|uniref:Major facilitator superfamily (MFS) profile domain-containing protein n=1 Tax=Hortaea werneckii TaxID=91943 RepID=A0A3M7EUM5_HORWE|nr:hypothetical protein D0864_08733 [Hortaea werneckii]
MKPLVCLVYLMNYIDRNNYPAPRLEQMFQDSGISNNPYSIGLSILFVGCVLAQVPSNLLLDYCGRPYLGFLATLWRLVSTLSSQTDTASRTIALPFILGLVGKQAVVAGGEVQKTC